MGKRSQSSRLMVMTGPVHAHVVVVVDPAPALHHHVARVHDRQNARAIRAHGDAIALIVADAHDPAADDPDHR